MARRSWGDLETTMCSRETLGCLHQSSVTHVGRRDPADGKGLIGRFSKPTGTGFRHDRKCMHGTVTILEGGGMDATLDLT